MKALAAGLVPDCSGGCGWPEFVELLENLLDFGLKIVVPIAALTIAYGGFLLLVAGGDEKKIATGRAAIIAALVGVAIVYGSYIIVTSVFKAITGG